MDASTTFRLVTGGLLALFLPLTALTYYAFRRYRRASEVERVLNILKVDPEYQKVHRDLRPGYHYFAAVTYASVLAALGLLLLFFAEELGMAEFPDITVGGNTYPRAGSRIVFSMAFLGGYLWGLQYVFRRYAQNDLLPGVYYSLCLRMLLAATLALVIYNAYGALTGGDGAQSTMDITLWPAVAFLLGMFPQRGLRWLTERAPIFASDPDPSVTPAPLEMIQGMAVDDQLRLQEVGIDTCYDLATADFVPLILRTPYGARELVDWILQAKLCVYAGDAMRELRAHGIRTVIDLEPLKPEDLDLLAAETPMTRASLQRARDSVVGNPEIRRMREASALLGKFWEGDSAAPVPASGRA